MLRTGYGAGLLPFGLSSRAAKCEAAQSLGCRPVRHGEQALRQEATLIGVHMEHSTSKSRRTTRAWCSQCGREVETVDVETACRLAAKSRSTLASWRDLGKLHSFPTVAAVDRICAASLSECFRLSQRKSS